MKLRRDSTCDVLDDPKAFRPNSLAIRLDKAGELWGYGRAVQSSVADAQPSTWADLVQNYKQCKTDGMAWQWTADRLKLLRDTKAARGTGAAAALAGELGVSVEAVNGALRRSRKRPSATPVGRVVSFSNAGGN